MKALTLFLLVLCHNLLGQTNIAFHPAMHVTNVAMLTNLTLNQKAPNTKDVRSTMNSISIASQDLRQALRELLETIEDPQRALFTNSAGITNAVLRLHNKARSVSVWHHSYQQTFGRDGLKADLKNVVEDALLAALKKMEWIAQRNTKVHDDLFHSYYYTLLRYLEVKGGWLIKDGVFVQVPLEQKKR